MQHVIFVIWFGRVGNQNMEHILDYKFVFIFDFFILKRKIVVCNQFFNYKQHFLVETTVFNYKNWLQMIVFLVV
jgi:hypothetical protein